MEDIRVAEQKLWRIFSELCPPGCRRVSVQYGGVDTVPRRKQGLQHLELILFQRLDREQQQSAGRTVSQKVFEDRQEIGEALPGCCGGDNQWMATRTGRLDSNALVRIELVNSDLL